MKYLKTFSLSTQKYHHTHIYPYNVFEYKDIVPFIFNSITVFYGNNGSGKSTILNLIAQKLHIKGQEMPIVNTYGNKNYCEQFLNECRYTFDSDDYGHIIKQIPKQSLYLKSEDILYEIKKIQQVSILQESYETEMIKKGMTLKQAQMEINSKKALTQLECAIFAQEKYSNGETAMQFFEEVLIPGGLYLLDEPEVSLSPQNQVQLAKTINELARFLDCQFIIATNSPFMLGVLDAKIYNIDNLDMREQKWTELPNVRYFYQFFKERDEEFHNK